jgi:hypothetical protein
MILKTVPLNASFAEFVPVSVMSPSRLLRGEQHIASRPDRSRIPLTAAA